jgi:hypothetical protein
MSSFPVCDARRATIKRHQHHLTWKSCCQFLWIVHFALPLRCSLACIIILLTFVYSVESLKMPNEVIFAVNWQTMIGKD